MDSVKREKVVLSRSSIRDLKTTSFAILIAPLIRLDDETYPCQLQLPGLKVQGSTAVAFVAEFLTQQKFLKPIRELITAHIARHLQA
jgi:hypothetical protein